MSTDDVETAARLVDDFIKLEWQGIFRNGVHACRAVMAVPPGYRPIPCPWPKTRARLRRRTRSARVCRGRRAVTPHPSSY
jgi:hypothetical protein